MGDAGLDGRVEIVHADAQDLVHLRQVDAHAAVEREHLPLERRPGAERDDRHAALRPRRRTMALISSVVRGYATRSGAAGV